MKSSSSFLLSVLAVGLSFGVQAAATASWVEGVYVITVPAGDIQPVSATMAAEMGSGPMAKRGGGTLTADDMMANYAGEIRIEDGIYKVTTAKGCGTSAGSTVVSAGATFWQAGGDYARDGWGKDEKFLFAGRGYNDTGAYYRTGGNGIRHFTLTDDAFFNIIGAVESRMGGSVDMGRHTLTVRCSSESNYFMLCNSYLSNMGDVIVEKGRFQFQTMGSISGSAANTITIKKGAYLDNWTMAHWQPWTLVIEDGGGFRFGSGVWLNASVWSGPIILQGDASIICDREWGNWWASGPRFYGKVSGPGGITMDKGLWLQLDNAANDFTGPVKVQGLNSLTNGHLYLAANGALPAAAKSLTLSNHAVVHLKGPEAYSLPPLVVDGAGQIVDEVGTRPVGGKIVAPSLLKTGEGVLDMVTPMTITGEVDIQGGTLRLPKLPLGNAGLAYYENHSASIVENYPQITSETQLPFRYYDIHGPSYAFKSWPYPCANHIYKGYFFVSGSETVRWQFASPICRLKTLDIDDRRVLTGQDKYSSTFNWVRLTLADPVSLTPGWHAVKFTMNNYHDGTCGAAQQCITESEGADGDAKYWEKWKGLMYDPQCRGRSNSTDYVEFKDPGDGSFLRWSLGELDTDLYRGSFGSLKMAGGTTLDLNDTAPYTPLRLAELVGAPTITNGEVQVAGATWKLRKDDIEKGGPLTIANGAKLSFPADVQIEIEGLESLSHRPVRQYTLVKVAAGGALVNRPMLKIPSDWLTEWSDDGATLTLKYNRGLFIILK